MFSAVITAYGKEERKNADCIEAHWEEMAPVTETKRKAFLAYKAIPILSMLAAFRAARKLSQQTARRCANAYWLNLCGSIQLAAGRGDARGMQRGGRKAIPSALSKSTPSSRRQALRSPIKANSWNDGWSTSLSFTPRRTWSLTTSFPLSPHPPAMEELDVPPSTARMPALILLRGYAIVLHLYRRNISGHC